MSESVQQIEAPVQTAEPEANNHQAASPGAPDAAAPVIEVVVAQAESEQPNAENGEAQPAAEENTGDEESSAPDAASAPPVEVAEPQAESKPLQTSTDDAPAAAPSPADESPAPPSPEPPDPTPDPVADPTPDQPPRFLALMNQKGGVGKTTTAVNLGAALGAMGKRVLLVDLDPQAHLTLHYGIEPDSLEHTLYDLLTKDEIGAFDIVQHVTDNIAVLPSEVNLAGVESELAADMMTGRAQRILKEKCDALITQHGFDFLFIDCPPSLGLLTINALTLANEVIVPMQAHFLALQGLSKLLETVQLVSQGFNPMLQVTGIVLCMHERQTILASEIQNDLTTFLDQARGTGVPWQHAVVHDPPVRRNIKLAESPSFGQSIFDYAPDCHGAQDYRKLAESLIGQYVPR